MFSITGIIKGKKETIAYEWKNGVGNISGDVSIMFLMQYELALKSLVGPVGQYVERNLNDPLATLFMIKNCFEEITEHEGNLPVAKPIPDGAIC